MTTPAGGEKFGPILLAPGITKGNWISFMVVAYTTIGLLAFVGVGTPLVLNLMGVPVAEHGRVSGNLGFINELTMLAAFYPLGVMADRLGRREIFAAGLLIMGLAYVVYPLAGSVTELYGYRAIYALGIAVATAMLGTIVADYPAEQSRGKAVALIGMLNGLGVMSMVIVLGGVPEVLTDRGMGQVEAGRMTFWIVAGLCTVSAVVAMWGLKKGTPVKFEDRLPVKELLTSGFREARNPRIALAYASAFIARSDMVILGTFVVLWGNLAGMNAGLPESEALSKGRVPFIIASSVPLLWLPVLGLFILDKVNRCTGVAICMGLATAGFLGTLMIDDPLSSAAFGWFALLGVGQISTFAGATTLIGQEAPQASRGAVVGMFNLFGAIGILISVVVGGQLFDRVGPAAPFAFIGALTFIVMVFAIIVRIVSPGPALAGGAAPAVVGH